MRIKVITDSDDTILRDMGNPWVIGPGNKADVESKIKCQLKYTRAGWVLIPLQKVTVDGEEHEVYAHVVLPEKVEVRAGNARLTLQTL